MHNDGELSMTLVVKHGREQEAADFYQVAFGARVVTHHHGTGGLMAVDMDFGTVRICVAGANPKRDEDGSLGGPRSPEASGTLSATLRLAVRDLEAAVSTATGAGATVRDPIQNDTAGRRVATLFDPFGHFWALVQRQRAELSEAA